MKISEEYKSPIKNYLLLEYKILRHLSGGIGIPKVYCFGKENNDTNNYYLVQELLGNNLTQELKKYKKFPKEMYINIALQMISRIEFLHSKGFIHCDIKPENFVVKFDRNKKHFPILKLIDFGNSRKMDNEGDNLKNFSGTLCYMAPELFERNGFNEKVDEWAAGIIMYNMLTGCYPINYNSDSDYNSEILNTNINFNMIKNERLRELNKKLLEKCVEKRISAKEALNEIKIIKNDIITRKIFNNINNEKIENYFNSISKKLNMFSLS
jgi:serine/threonine protein kinase